MYTSHGISCLFGSHIIYFLPTYTNRKLGEFQRSQTSTGNDIPYTSLHVSCRFLTFLFCPGGGKSTVDMEDVVSLTAAEDDQPYGRARKDDRQPESRKIDLTANNRLGSSYVDSSAIRGQQHDFR